ncbi:MAG: NAD(P)-dependent oxidoreductase, partial [Candidatus Rokuibacteriota bacterium]
MPGRFAGQVAIVTAGGSGIGAATARRFAGEGAAVVVADLSGTRAEAVV